MEKIKEHEQALDTAKLINNLLSDTMTSLGQIYLGEYIDELEREVDNA